MLNQDATNRLILSANALNISPSELVMTYVPNCETEPTTRDELIPTAEQRQIVRAFKYDDDLTVDARSGTGKSTTLFMCARETMPSDNGIYLTFNSHTAKDAIGKIPNNVTARTIHSLAYEHVGVRYKSRLKQFLSATKLVSYYDLSSFNDYINDYAAARLIIGALSAFCHSSDSKLKINHVDPKSIESFSKPQQKEIRIKVKNFASDLWNEMLLTNSDMPVTHDFYLKVFSMTCGDLGYDFMLVDEAQDMTPAMMLIIEKQECKKIKVGDIYQSLYTYRTDNNFEDTIELESSLRLTCSFRFGTEIAKIANTVLNELNAPTRSLFDTTYSVQLGKSPKEAVICRTNEGLLAEYLRLYTERIMVNLEHSKGVLKSFGNSLLSLYQNEQPSHNQLMAHRNWSEFTFWAEKNGSVELNDCIRYIGQMGHEQFNTIISTLPSNEQCADLINVTKSKGREWDTVYLGQDFMTRTEPDREFQYQKYVAITRAMSSVL